MGPGLVTTTDFSRCENVSTTWSAGFQPMYMRLIDCSDPSPPAHALMPWQVSGTQGGFSAHEALVVPSLLSNPATRIWPRLLSAGLCSIRSLILSSFFTTTFL